VVEAIVTSDAFLRRAGRRELSTGAGSGGWGLATARPI